MHAALCQTSMKGPHSGAARLSAQPVQVAASVASISTAWGQMWTGLQTQVQSSLLSVMISSSSSSGSGITCRLGMSCVVQRPSIRTAHCQVPLTLSGLLAGLSLAARPPAETAASQVPLTVSGLFAGLSAGRQQRPQPWWGTSSVVWHGFQQGMWDRGSRAQRGEEQRPAVRQWWPKRCEWALHVVGAAPTHCCTDGRQCVHSCADYTAEEACHLACEQFLIRPN